MRRDNRLAPITEADYIDLERGYYQIASAAGLPSTFLDSQAFPMDGKMQTGVTQLIGHDVSLAEWRTRVTAAEEASRTANAPVRDILVKEYKFTEGDITAAFLDPAAAISIVEARRNLGAAGLMAESGRVLGTSQRFNRNLSDVLQEMVPNEIGYRQAIRVWYENSWIRNVLSTLGQAGYKIVITSDHGSLRVNRPALVAADKHSSSGVRYKSVSYTHLTLPTICSV